MKIGIVGAGQLGQMLGFAAKRIGVECVFLDPGESPPAAACGEVRQAAYDDINALRQLAQDCDIVSYEFENVPVDALRAIAAEARVFPPPDALHYAQDRLYEKQLLAEVGIPLPGYAVIDSRADIDAAADQLGLPMVIKTRRLGYDGKGQRVVSNSADCDAAWSELGQHPLIAEQWVHYDKEVSCIGARNEDGDIAIYPISHNVHRDGILRTSVSPLPEPELQAAATGYVTALLTRLDYVGVIALELFVVGQQLLANEFAPRVHNSGHWTIEGSATSQFENHVLAVLNRPLGPTDSVAHAGMVNLIGEIPTSVRELEKVYLHDYGKSARPGRKLGHVTVIDSEPGIRDQRVENIDKSVTQSTNSVENAP